MTDLEKWLEMMGLGKPGGGKLGGAMSIGSGIYGMMQARDLKKMAEEAMRDPLAGQRQQYAGELSALRADPSRLTSLPGYKAGEQAVQRSMASQGYLGSGNMMVALQDYGGRIYDAEVQRLSDLAGFGFNPKAGVGAGVSGAASAADLASRSLASLGYGARSFF
jgi:hypothetical protein